MSATTTAKADGENENIIVVKKPGGGSGQKSPSQIPFEAYYEEDTYRVRTEFSAPQGVATVTLVNEDTGVSTSGTILAQGTVYTPVTLGTGYYTITWTLSNSQTYIGSFVVY